MPDYQFKKTPQFSLKVAKEKEQSATPAPSTLQWWCEEAACISGEVIQVYVHSNFDIFIEGGCKDNERYQMGGGRPSSRISTAKDFRHELLDSHHSVTSSPHWTCTCVVMVGMFRLPWATKLPENTITPKDAYKNIKQASSETERLKYAVYILCYGNCQRFFPIYSQAYGPRGFECEGLSYMLFIYVWFIVLYAKVTSLAPRLSGYYSKTLYAGWTDPRGLMNSDTLGGV